MLMNAHDSTLLVIDVQERLLPHIHEVEGVLEHTGWLIKVARKLGVPVMATEQYSKGLGPTHAAIAALLPEGCLATKMHFSCVAARCLTSLAGHERRQMVVCGIETHVCVLQTVLELRQHGKEVYVVEEACGSRRPTDKALALERMRAAGAVIVSREMVAFEWLHEAGTPLFKEIQKTLIK